MQKLMISVLLASALLSGNHFKFGATQGASKVVESKLGNKIEDLAREL